MNRSKLTRRDFLASATGGGLAACALPALAADSASEPPTDPAATGSQRLSLAQLRKWEALEYGMFIHFGMSTFVQNELPDGKAPATTYAPDKLDVDQWVSVAKPRADEALLKQFQTCRAGGANFLLDVPPDKHGLIPDETVAALTRLRKNLKL